MDQARLAMMGTRRPLASRLVEDIADGIRVFVRLGVPLTEDQVYDRARNIAAGLITNYSVTDLPDTQPRRNR